MKMVVLIRVYDDGPDMYRLAERQFEVAAEFSVLTSLDFGRVAQDRISAALVEARDYLRQKPKE